MYGMKPGKRLLTWIMVFVMTLSMLPLNVLASYPVEPAKIIKPDVGTYLTYQFYVGENKVDEQIVKEGETLLAPKTPEAAEGQRFTGWYKGTEKFEGFGKPQGPIAASDTIRLDAKFDDVFYVFFVDTQDRIVATREGQSGDTITFADVSFPVKSDESITGWYLEKDLTTEVYSVKLENEDVTLYAKVEKGHWITFDSDGGSYVAPQFVTKGGSTAQPKDDPTKAGFTFDGWLLKGAAFTFGSALDDDIKLTAKWKAKETVSYTVIHWLENADDTEYSYKESETKSGAAGNQTTATTKKYDGFTAQTIEQQTIAGDGSTIVNVRYKRNVYEVKFYSVKWERTGLFSGHYVADKLLKTISAKHGAFIGNQWPTINGSSTWQTNPSGQPYQVNIETMPLGGATFYGPKTGSGSETAYYYVEVLPGETGTLVGGKYYRPHHEDTSPGTDYTVSAEDQYPITGYTFNAKISTKLKADYNNAKFYYDRNNYNVVYMNNGEKVNEKSYKFGASIADAGSYTPPRPEGIDAAYVFNGWYADPAGAQPYDFTDKTMPAQNVTVYAHWAAPVHKVTFKVDGQPDQTMENVAHNATITLPPAPTPPDGEDFLGWVDENGKPFKEDTQITRNLVLTAKFGSKTGYTVTYDTTDGNGTVSDVNHYGKGAAATVLNGADTAPDGKVFLYWVDTTGDKYYPNNTITINGNVKLTAVYGETSQPVAITYHSNFGTDSTVPSNNIPNNGLIEILTYTATGLNEREGYTFDGWNTQSGGDGLAFAAGGQARVDSTAPNDLYAQWTVNQYNYTVQYYYDGKLDSTATETPKADYGSVINDYPDKIREGYELEKTEDLPLTVGINEADNVIKVYYVKTTVPYTIHHYLNGTTVSVASDMTGRVAVGETQSATVATTFLSGYEAAEKFLVPAAVTVTAAMTEVTLTVYYKMPLTIKADDDTKMYDGTPLTCPTFTVTGLVNGDQAADITLSMTANSTITNAGTQANTIDETTVTGIKGYYKVLCQPGTLTITPDTAEITVTITGNNNTKQYTGSEQSVTGFTTDVGDKPITVALKDGKTAIAKGTNVGKYTMGLTEDDFTVTSTNYSNIKVKVVDGFLEITANTAEITVTITGNNDTKQYNGSEQSATGFTADVGSKPITVALKEGKEAIAKGTDVGKYTMGLTKDDFTVTSANYSNIKVEVIDGFLEITPNDSVEINVKIVGKNDSRTYTGLMQKVEGFTYTVDVKGTDVTVALKDGKKAVAEGLSAGTYHMGLTKEFFDVTSKNYSNIKVEVVDGFLVINYTPYVPPTVKIEDDDALGLNTTDHFAYIIGYPDGTVQPNGQITRAEVATIFFRLLTEDVRTANLSRSNRYFDVAASEWYNTAVSTLSSMGIITGYPDGTFRPNAYITRAEFAAIAARFDPSGDKTTASFRDILNHWAKDEISIAYNNSWVDGYPDGTFGPQRNITRAETMTLVNRVLNRRPETEEDLLPEMTIWTDNANPNAWYYLAVQEATNSHYYKFKTNSKYEKWTELRENRDWTQLEK